MLPLIKIFRFRSAHISEKRLATCVCDWSNRRRTIDSLGNEWRSPQQRQFVSIQCCCLPCSNCFRLNADDTAPKRALMSDEHQTENASIIDHIYNTYFEWMHFVCSANWICMMRKCAHQWWQPNRSSSSVGDGNYWINLNLNSHYVMT